MTIPTKYTVTSLIDNKTISEMKNMVRELGLVGVLKKRKDVMAKAIVDELKRLAESGIPTVAELEEKTCSELRDMCASLDITGVSKKRKEFLIDLLINAYKSDIVTSSTLKDNHVEVETEIDAGFDVVSLNSGKSIVSKIGFETIAELKNKNARTGDKMDKTIRVSSGSSSSDIQFAGQTVETILNTFDEIFNIDRSSNIMVNGKSATLKTVLKAGDNLEFLKAAGSKHV